MNRISSIKTNNKKGFIGQMVQEKEVPIRIIGSDNTYFYAVVRPDAFSVYDTISASEHSALNRYLIPSIRKNSAYNPSDYNPLLVTLGR